MWLWNSLYMCLTLELYTGGIYILIQFNVYTIFIILRNDPPLITMCLTSVMVRTHIATHNIISSFLYLTEPWKLPHLHQISVCLT